jgi:hypothetical protein
MSLTKVSYSMIKGAAANVLDYGADPTGVADSTAAIQAAINTGQTVWIPIGTYSITTLDLKQRYPTIIGESMVATILRARSSVVTMVDAYETTDGQVVPLFISNLTMDGNNFVTGACVQMRFRHMSNIESVYFLNATSSNASGFFAVDCWLTSLNNCRFTTCYNGLNFYGSNHRSAVNSCSFTGCTNAGVTCTSLGTALDGNNALVFNNCDMEFGTGLGVYLSVSDAAFYGCYVGENLNGPAFFVDAGNILVSSGVLYFGHTVNTFGVTGNGGRVLFDKCTVNGQTNGGITFLMSGGLKNYYKWQDCNFGIGLGGNPVISGDRLDYGPPAVVFAHRLGKNYTPSYNNATGTLVVGDKSQRVTCATAPGPTPIIGLQCSLINPSQAVTGERLYLVLVYKLATASGTPDIRISGTPFGGAPTTVIGNPTPSASVATYIKLDTTFPSGAYTVLEFQIINCAVGDYLEIQECFLADNRMLQQITGTTEMANLYKC